MITATNNDNNNNNDNMILINKLNRQSRKMMEKKEKTMMDMNEVMGQPKVALEKNVNDLMKWITAGENELYLRQMIDATLSETQTGYSIPHFDFLIYFKHKNVRENNAEEPLKYLRKLILSEFLVKVRTNTKYQNFHKRHDAMIKLWQQMVRVISFESTVETNKNATAMKEDEDEDMFNASDDDDMEEDQTHYEKQMKKDAVRAIVDDCKQKRIQIIRNYMVYCQNHQQSKTQQCADLKNIFNALWNIEAHQEQVEKSQYNNLSLQAFSQLWNTRYNTQNRIVINASDEQLEARAMFCHSANALLQYVNYFNKSPLSNRSIASLCAQLKHFIATNNNANNYNVNVQALSNPFANTAFQFSKESFITDLLPSIRNCCASLSRVAALQGNVYLSLYESFWDVSFIVSYFNTLVCLMAANRFDVASSPLLELQSQQASTMLVNNRKKRKKVRKLHSPEHHHHHHATRSTKLLKRIKRFIQD